MVFLTIFQHGLNERMQGWLCKDLIKYFAMDMDEKAEFWVADLRLEPDGRLYGGRSGVFCRRIRL